MSKKIFVTALCCLLAVCLAWSASAQDDMTLEQVLEKHAEARGGHDAFDAIDSAKVSAKMMMGQGMEAPITLYVKQPNKLRVEIQVQGQSITQAWNGEKGWQIMPLMGNPDPQEMSDSEAKQIKQQDLIRGILMTYDDLGYTAEYLGVGEIEGTPAHKVKITMEDGDASTSYLDTDHFIEFLREVEGVNPQTGQPGKMTITLGDYKEVAGVMTAYSFEMVPEGAPMGMAITIEDIEVNSGDVSDDLFEMPEVEAPAESGEG